MEWNGGMEQQSVEDGLNLIQQPEGDYNYGSQKVGYITIDWPSKVNTGQYKPHYTTTICKCNVGTELWQYDSDLYV